MKKCFYLLILPVLFACKKDKQTSGSGLLIQIKSANKVEQTFEYQAGLLSKVNYYFLCTVPSDETSYFYQNGRLEKVAMTMRSMYSSSSAICDPARGMKSEETFVYNSSGRLIRTNRANNYTEYNYSAEGNVSSETIFQLNGTPINTTTYKYDSRRNLIEEIGPSGQMQYQYDEKVNPFYVMKQKPSYISAFTTSPNNVIKGTNLSGSGFERTILEYQNGMPLRVMEDGVEYLYIYQ